MRTPRLWSFNEVDEGPLALPLVPDGVSACADLHDFLREDHFIHEHNQGRRNNLSLDIRIDSSISCAGTDGVCATPAYKVGRTRGSHSHADFGNAGCDGSLTH